MRPTRGKAAGLIVVSKFVCGPSACRVEGARFRHGLR